MSSITNQISAIRQTIPTGVELLCVSKFHPEEAILEAYHAGERMFGESRVQELLRKQQALPHDIQWHFIGHLQTNKIRQILPFVSLIHGVDSLHLLEAISAEARKLQLAQHPNVLPPTALHPNVLPPNVLHPNVLHPSVLPPNVLPPNVLRPNVLPPNVLRPRVLLEVHVAQEETKFGFSIDELRELAPKLQQIDNVEICGIMGMASFTDDTAQIRREFRSIRQIFDELKATVFASSPHFSILSMGMSDDYQIAIEEGSTMVRIGTNIFGARQ